MLEVKTHRGFQPCIVTGVHTDKHILVKFLNGNIMWIQKSDYNTRPNHFVKGNPDD